MSRAFTPEEDRLIKSSNGRLPMWLIAELLSITVPQLNYRRRQLEISSERGSTPRTEFLWNFDAREFSSLTGEHLRKIKLIRVRELNELCVKRSSVEFRDDDLLPLHAVEEYHGTIPDFILRELLGLSEKTYIRLRRVLGKKHTSSSSAELSATVYRSCEYPETSALSAGQQQRMRELIDAKRAEFDRAEKQRLDTYAAALLDKLREKKRKFRRPQAETELRPCATNRCRNKWPPSTDFFYHSVDTSDELSPDCKYCSLLKSRSQRKGSGKKRKRFITGEEQEHLIEVLKAIHQEVPVGYIRELYELSVRQLGRLRSLAGLEASVPDSHRLLRRWRMADHIDVQRFTEVSDYERERLRAIWDADRDGWAKYLEENDAAMLEVLEHEQARIAREQSDVVAKGIRACRGGCGNSWWQTQFFFPREVGRKYKGYCRHCFNRAQRKS